MNYLKFSIYFSSIFPFPFIFHCFNYFYLFKILFFLPFYFIVLFILFKNCYLLLFKNLFKNYLFGRKDIFATPPLPHSRHLDLYWLRTHTHFLRTFAPNFGVVQAGHEPFRAFTLPRTHHLSLCRLFAAHVPYHVLRISHHHRTHTRTHCTPSTYIFHCRWTAFGYAHLLHHTHRTCHRFSYHVGSVSLLPLFSLRYHLLDGLVNVTHLPAIIPLT